MTYVGPGSGTPWIDLGIKFVGSQGNTYGGFEDYCGVIPDGLSDKGELFPGASTEGNVCMAVPADQIQGGSAMVEHQLSLRPSRVFFAVS